MPENINLERIGGTVQSGADVFDTTNHAIKVNVVAGVSAAGDASAANQVIGNASLANIDGHIDVALSTRLKPADTLTGVTTVAAVTAITNALPAGTNLLGKVSTDQTTHGTSDLVAADITKVGGVAVALNDNRQTVYTESIPVQRLLEMLLHEQRISNLLLLKIAQPYSPNDFPEVTDPKRGNIQ